MVTRLPIVVVAALFALPLAMPLASADGMMHYYSSVYDDWNLSAEETQYGMINYVDGEERFMLTIRVDSESLDLADAAVWMFAIPADSDTIDIDLMPAVTELNGETVADLARKELCSNLLLGYGTQLYPILMLPLFGAVDSPLALSDGYRGLLSTGGDVEVTQHVESSGLTAEVVSTTQADALESYLEDRELHLDDAADSLIAEYIGQDYSFIISWISDMEQFRDEGVLQYDHSTESYYYELGLYSVFPTDRIFYPLRLTSIYGETVVPMMLQILGHVEPDDSAFDYGKLGIAVRHSVDDRYYIYVSQELSEFFTSDAQTIDPYGDFMLDVKYTEVVITAPSEQLEVDLWMVPTSSASLDVQQWIQENGFVTATMVIIVLSVMTGVIAGIIVFGQHRPVLWKFAALGLANLLTIIGLWLVARRLEIERTMTRSEIPLSSRQYRSDFLFVYTFVFIVSITSVLFVLWR
ncbi:MAG TPA: hypothetical protein VMW71_03625 [Thermoplasmata archaeon]|nr:hypothetical protein [Thermoplasmata archaeon]